ncbi:spermatogenesis-associated protein 7 homolog isoform X2 [Nematostella vectensis]|uniref:spermatogenesis-associated protein 7 homolog isoform X2 n=1 Tax=Nematostella vectensis TaxID=45351 RepID=UPI00207741B5|nr:spermatogenesis-associated protein 7 homolog isoform X2 [Nematostella vectensis]
MSSLPRQNRGHLTLKSSVLSPTAMSYMGQAMVLNHMNSHYRRISSAKASVDTSAPKSMKKHIRVKDQKKREILKSGGSTPGRRTRSASLENIASPLVQSPHPQSNRWHQRSNSVTSSRRESVTSEQEYQMETSRLDKQMNSTAASLSRPSPRELHLDLGKTLKKSSPMKSSPKPLPKPLVSHNRWKSVQNNKMQTPVRPSNEEQRKVRVQTTNHERQHNVTAVDSAQDITPNGTINNCEKELSSYQSTPQKRERRLSGSYMSYESPRLHYSSSLNSTRLSSRLETPLQRRLRDEKEMETKLWEEEQLYMQFISDVTSDILARGIFTNRIA